jgi:hypothetical protein
MISVELAVLGKLRGIHGGDYVREILAQQLGPVY